MSIQEFEISGHNAELEKGAFTEPLAQFKLATTSSTEDIKFISSADKKSTIAEATIYFKRDDGTVDSKIIKIHFTKPAEKLDRVEVAQISLRCAFKTCQSVQGYFLENVEKINAFTLGSNSSIYKALKSRFYEFDAQANILDKYTKDNTTMELSELQIANRDKWLSKAAQTTSTISKITSVVRHSILGSHRPDHPAQTVKVETAKAKPVKKQDSQSPKITHETVQNFCDNYRNQLTYTNFPFLSNGKSLDESEQAFFKAFIIQRPDQAVNFLASAKIYGDVAIQSEGEGLDHALSDNYSVLKTFRDKYIDKTAELRAERKIQDSKVRAQEAKLNAKPKGYPELTHLLQLISRETDTTKIRFKDGKFISVQRTKGVPKKDRGTNAIKTFKKAWTMVKGDPEAEKQLLKSQLAQIFCCSIETTE